MRNRAAISTPDANHANVVGWYEQMYCGVLDLHTVGFGCPDLLVHFSGYCAPVEIKTEDGKLSESQKRFIREWKGPKIMIVRTQQDVIDHVTSVRKRIAVLPQV